MTEKEDGIYLDWRDEVRNAIGRVQRRAQWFIVEGGNARGTGISDRCDRARAEESLDVYRLRHSKDALKKIRVKNSSHFWLRSRIADALDRPEDFAGTIDDRTKEQWMADAVIGAMEQAFEERLASEARISEAHDRRLLNETKALAEKLKKQPRKK